MAVPTEVLNDDVKELKADIREIRGHLDSLKDDVHRVDVSLARLQTEFGLAKWLLGLLLVTAVTATGSGIWWASSINSTVTGLEKRFDKLEAAVLKAIEQPKGETTNGQPKGK